jgi:NADP-dependent 3-hydroxy acid dehydrogenase YdfG
MSRTAVIVGVGPGLGMSIAHRFGREGFTTALISRTDTRHADYLRQLADAGVKAEAFTADVTDPDQVKSVLDRIGPADVVYHGPTINAPLTSLDKATVDDVRAGMATVYAAVDVVGHVLPAMLAGGEGTILVAGGLSAVRPLPMLGSLAVATAGLRNYVLTLNATIAGTGVHAANLIVGGLIERGDIHAMVQANLDKYGPIPTLNPDAIAEAAWDLHVKRDRAEEIFSALA